MYRESHLFACHKYLEDVGSQILTSLAKADVREDEEIALICARLEEYLDTLKNHAHWEKEFIFDKFFTSDDGLALFSEHAELESAGKKILEELKALMNVQPQSRMLSGKQVYLDFRKFYASNLIHFNDEETSLLSLLQERATDDEIRAIDQPIYQGMDENDIVEMLKLLLPPANVSEKKNILGDLRAFNPSKFELALPKIKKLLTSKETAEILTQL